MAIPIDEIMKMAELYKAGDRTIESLSLQFKRDNKAISRHFRKIGIHIKTHTFRPDNNFWKTNGRLPRNPLDYFNSSYLIDNQTECWEWQRGKNKRGYGQFWIKKTMIGAHRFSYLHYKGEIEAGLLICHTCDNPGCVNPAHLFLGTHLDNMKDKITKGRAKYGKGAYKRKSERNINSLSDWDWLIIKEVKKLGMNGTDIAKLYKVSVLGLYAAFKEKNI